MFLQKIKIFFLLYFVVIAALFYLFHKKGASGPVLPGDVYIRRGTRTIYLPFLSAFLLTVILSIILLIFL